MTYGEELLCELAKSVPVDSYLSAEQQEELRQVESNDDLKEFLAKNGLRGVIVEGDIPIVADSLVSSMRFDFAVGNVGCEGCLCFPITLQAIWLIDTFRMRRLRCSLADLLTFVTLFAVCLSYEVSIAPVYLGMPQQLLLALPVALLLGAFPSYIFKNPRWVFVSLDVIVLMETIAFVNWCRS